MLTFWHSLALVFLGQIPLLLKLWFDHRERASPFARDFYAKQMSSFSDVIKHLKENHDHARITHTLHHEGSLPAKKTDTGIDMDAIYKSYLQQDIHLGEAIGTHYIFLPARIILLLDEYRTLSAQLKAMAFGIAPTPTPMEETPQKLWERLNVVYHQVLNTLRIAIGTDALSEDVARRLNLTGKLTLISPGDKAD